MTNRYADSVASGVETAYLSPMPKKLPPKPEEKPQHERFIEAAREVGVDETGKEFERAMERITPPRPKPKR